MSHSSVNSGFASQDTAINTFMAVSEIYLESAERLLALNAATARQAIAGGAAFASSLAGGGPDASGRGNAGELANAMFETALGYSQGLQDIARRVQEAVAHSMVGALRAPDLAMPVPTPWFEWMTVLGGTPAKDGNGRRRAAPAARAA